MASKYENEKGFLVIAMTPDEAIDNCHFGFYDKSSQEYYLVDDRTNDNIINSVYVYYIAVLNMLVGISSLNEWLESESTFRFTEDIPLEIMNYNHIAKKLDVELIK